MRSMVFGVMAAAGLTLVASPGAAAQESGWWGWALEEVVRARYGSAYDRGDDRYRERQGGSTLPERAVEVILGRDRGDDDGWGRADRDARDRDARSRRRGSGPPFCRSGRGHPVHGMAWCREKGWAGSRTAPVLWQRDGGWGGIDLGKSRLPRSGGGVIDRGGLIDILGEVVFGRLVRNARLDRDDGISGRWLMPADRSRVLQIRSRSGPIAELSDVDGDGRVDVVLVPER